MSAEGVSDEVLLQRLSAIYSEAFVAEIAAQLTDARKLGQDKRIAEIHERFTYRMHDLGEFMKGLLQRFTQWFNRTQSRTGRLWEDRFKSVIVEDGFAAKTMAAYIDLNPVRAGMVKDPADYRWSSYGEAIGGGPKGNGKTARAGLVRALRAHKGAGADASLWKNDVVREYRKLLMEGALEKSEEVIDRTGKRVKRTLRKGISREESERLAKDDDDLPVAAMAATLRRRVRYFSDGAVIGSRLFVNEAFHAARDRFGAKRKDGARKLRGQAAGLAGKLWSFRDLQKEVG